MRQCARTAPMTNSLSQQPATLAEAYGERKYPVLPWLALTESCGRPRAATPETKVARLPGRREASAESGARRRPRTPLPRRAASSSSPPSPLPPVAVAAGAGALRLLLLLLEAAAASWGERSSS